MNVAPSQESSHEAIASEQALLGALILSPDSYSTVQAIVRPDYFSEPIHRFVYEAISECREAGRKGSISEIMQAIGARNAGSDIGGISMRDYIARVTNETSTLAASDYARVVRDIYVLRRLQDIALSNADIDGGGLAEHRLSAAWDALDSLRAETAESGGTWRPVGEIASSVVRRVQDIRTGEAGEPGVTTGFPDLDRMILGYRPGELIVIAGRPGMGKSVVALSSAIALSDPDHPRGGGVGFFSLELSDDSVGARALSDIAYRSKHSPTHSDIRAGRLEDHQCDDIVDAQRVLDGRLIIIDTRSSITVGEVEARARAMQRRYEKMGRKLNVIFIDYLKQVKATDRYRGNRVYEIGEITTGLREIGKKLGICIVLLAQLNRGVEGREDKRPSMADLRESGDIENDADVVMLLYRPAYYLQRELKAAASDEKAIELHDKLQAAENKLEVIISKNRNGEGERTVELFCSPGHSAVRQLARGF
ncbi:replicative DNA helicase [Pseudochelatococcus contaminans]|uniref:DNA 5'-3' helicase n=1 Tax=Pseudochelatococcus contaminans TaxID=1538103 RepID=A0A7W6EFI7_9HYPH|nr:DnaB-like helicase C-terminal domain-containing protein [Pseudochelatococcus contaminans]MBB3808775.1 replicative DNA helicase [Pseudochelatococcus contaminans]